MFLNDSDSRTVAWPTRAVHYLERMKKTTTRRMYRSEVEGIELWRKSSKIAVKWSEVKCSDVKWNEAVGNVNEVKPNERVVKCRWVNFKAVKWWSIDKWCEVEWSVVKWSEVLWIGVKCCEVEWSVVRWIEGLTNRVSIMINKNTSLMQLISIYFTYIKSLRVSGRTLPIIRRIWYCTYQRLVLVR